MSAADRQFDARAVILSVFLLGFCPFLIQSWWTVLTGSAGIVGYLIIANLPLKALLKAVRRLIWFLLAIGGVNLFTTGGEVFVEVAGLYGTAEGLERGMALSARLILLAWCSVAVTHSAPPAKITEAFEVWLQPVRHLTGPLLVHLTTTFALIPSMATAARHVGMAYKARGVDFESGLLRKLRFLSIGALPLFSASFRSARSLATAIEARGYDPSAERSFYPAPRFSSRDHFLVAAAFLLCFLGGISSF